MKKFFVALMAVLVLASCGGKKEEAQVAMTEADVMMLTVEIMNNAADRIEKSTTADEMIDAMAAMAKDVQDAEEKAGDVIDGIEGLGQNELLEKYPEQAAAVQAAGMRYTEAVMGKMQLMENLTPEQEERLMKVFEGIAM